MTEEEDAQGNLAGASSLRSQISGELTGGRYTLEYMKSRRNYLELTHWLPEDAHVLSARPEFCYSDFYLLYKDAIRTFMKICKIIFDLKIQQSPLL